MSTGKLKKCKKKIIFFIALLLKYEYNKNMVTNIKRIRESKGLTQTQLAKASDVKVRTLQSYDMANSSIDSAKLETLLKIANALNCQIYELLEDKNLRKLMKDYEESIVN